LQANTGKLDPASLANLGRVVAASKRMGRLIDDLLNLARLSRQDLRWGNFSLSEMAVEAAASLAAAQPQRSVQISIQKDMQVDGDAGLMRAVIDNLVGNAWKFTEKTGAPAIDIGSQQRDGRTVYFVRDNGAGFDMQYANKLFSPFQRLHHASEFEGTGIGLATVRKVISRHGGSVWAEGAVGRGATIFFTLGQPG